MESGIQLAILHYLAYKRDIYWFRNNSFGGFIQRRNGSLGHINNAKRGMPDIVLCAHGRFIGVEVKGPKGRQSPEQVQAQVEIEQAGGLYWLVKSVDEVMAHFERLESKIDG